MDNYYNIENAVPELSSVVAEKSRKRERSKDITVNLKDAKKNKIVRKKKHIENFENISDESTTLHPLLAYTYFLDNLMTTHITIGYDATNFDPVILIRQSGDLKHINLSSVEWSLFFMYIQQNDKYSVNINKKLVIKKSDNFIHFRYKKVKFLMNLQTYDTLINLAPYINEVVLHYKNYKNFIDNYYKAMIKRCIEKDVKFLTIDDYFIIEDGSYLFLNYRRLYNEMIIFCKQKICKDIFFENLSKDINDLNSS